MTTTVASERTTAPAAGSARRARPTALVVGPLPPPSHGGSVATRLLLDSAVGERFRLVHVDTTDTRGIGNVGRFDFGNVRLALSHFLSFVRRLRQDEPALVYVPLAQSRLGFLRDALFLLPARMRGTAVVVHFHCGGFRGFFERTDPATRALVRASLRRVSRAIVLGENLRGMLDDVVPDGRVVVVPNGIPDPYDGALGRPAPPPAGHAQVLYLGTIRPEKGVHDLLAAAARLDDRPGVRLTVAGDFLQPADRRRAQAAAVALPGRVRFPGIVEGAAKAELYRSADIFAFPPVADEGHPFVILEAMAAGLAIVTTARGAIAETVVDGESGIIVPAGDSAALAAAIRGLADDPALRARLGAAARARFLERYTADAWSARMTAALEAALHELEPAAWR